MVFNVPKPGLIIRKGGIHERPWQPNVLKPASARPTIRDLAGITASSARANVRDCRTAIFEQVVKCTNRSPKW